MIIYYIIKIRAHYTTMLSVLGGNILGASSGSTNRSPKAWSQLGAEGLQRFTWMLLEPRKRLESQWLIVMGYFKPIMVYFGV